jgi:hypothetical protein
MNNAQSSKPWPQNEQRDVLRNVGIGLLKPDLQKGNPLKAESRFTALNQYTAYFKKTGVRALARIIHEVVEWWIFSLSWSGSKDILASKMCSAGAMVGNVLQLGFYRRFG